MLGSTSARGRLCCRVRVSIRQYSVFGTTRNPKKKRKLFMIKRFVFIDSRISNYESLIDRQQVDTQWVLLNADQDGLLQMQTALANYSGLNAIHVISHGARGTLYLGSTVLDSENLSVNESQLQAIGKSLMETGDLLLYGCNVAQGEDGIAFINAFSAVTGADVAASSNPTGASALGGNWVLEQITGTIDAAILLGGDATGLLSVNFAPKITHPLGTVTFASRVNYSAGGWISSIGTADVNNDGKLDLIAINRSESTVSILLGNGDGNFANRAYYTTGTFPLTHAAADLNGDGNFDLAIINTGTDSISILTGSSNGIFSLKSDYLLKNAYAITASDINGDGNADLLITSITDNNLHLLIGIGDGTFAVNKKYGTGESPQSVASADLDGDGKMDAIVSNTGSNTVSVFMGNANGTLSTQTDYAAGFRPRSIIAIDLNDDKNTDLVVANYEAQNFSVLMGNGDGTLYAKKEYAVGGSPIEVESADVNGDGKMDLVVLKGDENSRSFSVFIGNGDGTFTPPIEYGRGNDGDVIVTADLNGDGKLDVVIGNALGTVSVFMNTSPVLGTTTIFSEQTPVALTPRLLVNDANGNSDWNGGKLKVQITANFEAADTIYLPNFNPGGNAIWLDGNGNKLMAGTTHFGAADAPSVINGSAWTLSFNASATNALVQSTAQALHFNNTSDAPGIGNRTVTFTATDVGGLHSTGTQNIKVAAVNDAPTGVVSISGTATQGQTLTASNTLADVDGLGIISYQWSAGGNAIVGATGSTLVLGQAQVGKSITVTASYTDGFNTVEAVTSTASAAVLPTTSLGPTDDFVVLQPSTTAVAGAGVGNDVYLLSGSMIPAGKVITLSDSIGMNTLQLAPGLSVASSKVAATALQLNLTNGASINVLGADKFNYDVGGNISAGLNEPDLSYSQFVQNILGTTIPTSGVASGAALKVGSGIAANLLASAAIGNDFIVAQAASSAIIGAGAGNDTYLLSQDLLPSGTQISISDALGINSIQLASGLQIASAQVAATALRLNLTNGASITVLSANQFTFEAGGNTTAGIDQPDLSYAQFVQSVLSGSVPLVGVISTPGLVI